MQAIKAEIENDSQAGRSSRLQRGRAAEAPSRLILLTSIDGRTLLCYDLFTIILRMISRWEEFEAVSAEGILDFLKQSTCWILD